MRVVIERRVNDRYHPAVLSTSSLDTFALHAPTVTLVAALPVTVRLV